MPGKSSRNIADDVLSTARKAKNLFTSAISQKKRNSSSRLQTRLKRRSKSDPQYTLDSFEQEMDKELSKFGRSNSYKEFNRKLKALERQANVERSYSSSSGSDSDSEHGNDDFGDMYLDAIDIEESDWKATELDIRDKWKVSNIGRTAYAHCLPRNLAVKRSEVVAIGEVCESTGRKETVLHTHRVLT